MNYLLIFYLKTNQLYSANKYLLNKLSPYIKEICLVSNCQNIDISGLNINNIIFSTKPSSIYSYQLALDSYPKSYLSKFDRIIFANSDVVGPIISPETFFCALNESKEDVFYLENYTVSQISHYLFAIKIRDHLNIQDIIYKKSGISFKNFMESDNVQDSYISNSTNHILNNQSPFFSKEILTANPSKLIYNSLGLEPSNILKYITKQTKYPEDLIWDILISTTPMSILRNNFHQNYILSSTQLTDKDIEIKNKKIALICYIYYEDLIDYCHRYALSMPQNADIYIITCKESMTKACRKSFVNFPCKNIYFRQMENRGRDVAAYLVAAKDVFFNYDYICCIHDKKSPQYTPSISRDFSYHLFECNLSSSIYVSNIINTFEQNSRLGMLIPVFPNFGGGVQTIGNQMHLEAEKVKNLLKKFGFHIPYDNDVCAPLGTMFWVRGKAFLPIFKYDWKHSDFPPEPNKSSGTILHGIERFYAFVPQEAGYLVGVVSPIHYTSIYLDNMYWDDKNRIQAYLESIKISKQPVTRIHFSDIKNLVKQYVKQRIKKLFLSKPTNSSAAYIRYCGIQQESILIHMCTANKNPQIICNRKVYHPNIDNLNLLQQLNSVYNSYGISGYFFRIPLKEAMKGYIRFRSEKKEILPLIWNGSVLNSVLQLKKYGIYARIYNNKLFFTTKISYFFSILFGVHYSLRDKILFLLLAMNPVHKNIIFSENHNATDNAFELFKYSLKHNKNSYFVVSKKIYKEYVDIEIKPHLIKYNSTKHIWKLMFSRLWITSYTLGLELFPSTSTLKDIHYFCIPGRWIFIPHGMAVGDKNPIMCHKYSWDEPSRTYCCNEYEKDQFSQKYEFRHILALGDPRMDKWYGAKLDDNKIVLFFTWRISMARIKKEQFKESSYFLNILNIVEMIRVKFPQKHIYYVFHHEVVKAGIDGIIKKELGEKNISYIYFSSKEGGEEFNKVFKSAKYLITDYSSVAYDFAYKKGSIPIYYLNEDFINGHYPLEQKFYDIHLGVLTQTLSELEKALKMNAPTAEMRKRKNKFFKYQDNKNCERVYNAIFNQK